MDDCPPTHPEKEDPFTHFYRVFTIKAFWFVISDPEEDGVISKHTACNNMGHASRKETVG